VAFVQRFSLSHHVAVTGSTAHLHSQKQVFMADSLSSVLEKFSLSSLHPEDSLQEHLTTKCLVLKPKANKSMADAPAHVMVLALNDTAINMSNLAKHLGLKELRMAQEEVVTQVFQISKEAGLIQFLISSFSFGTL
jgi:hypothetical protein